MQIKKKVTGRNSARELASPKASKHQTKVSGDVQLREKKAAELITSSARKQKFAGTHRKKNGEHDATTNLNTRYGLVDDDTSSMCLGQNANHVLNNASMDPKACNEEIDNPMMDTIFSPTFHISRSVEGEIACEDLGGIMSSEVSAIYLSMKNSKLECIDEDNQDHISTDVCMADDECEEFEDFDPYFFIKNLPDLSSVVPTFRPVLLPKQTRSCPPTTLVLDLDETLVHSSLEPCGDTDFTFSVNYNLMNHTVFVRCRPHLKDFLERVSVLFEIIIFTASQSIYAEQLLNVLDPKRKIFRHRVYRESCVYVEGNYVKDLSVLGRDLARVIMIDNSPQAFGFQVDNGIPIESWFDDRWDQELLLLLPFLESLVGVVDVRPLIAKRFNVREKIAASVCPL